MSPCKLCGRNEALVKAHIIPESMYTFEAGRREPLLMIPSSPGIPPSRSQIGEYDPQLVCSACEARFHPWDDYAVRLFREEPAEDEYTYVDGEPLAYTIKTYDYAKLKLFFISLLWRASESGRPFFNHVSVGRNHAARLNQMIGSNDPGNPEEYSLFIVRIRYEKNVGKPVLSPRKQRWGNDRVCFWRFSLAGYMAAIKVDQRPTPSPLCKLILRPKGPLNILVIRFDDTEESKALINAIRNLRLN